MLLAEPVPFGEMRRVVLALAALLPSLDASPMLNVTAGCIRPPGATHKSGGLQELVTPWPAVQEAAAGPNPAAVWGRLVDTLDPQLKALEVGTQDEAAEPKPGPGRHAGRLSARMTEIARSGAHGYRSGSEARQAVLTAAAGAGWQLHDIARHLETGAWPGLASFYTRPRILLHSLQPTKSARCTGTRLAKSDRLRRSGETCP